jgi:dolichol-phosphate mannosyltransferase
MGLDLRINTILSIVVPVYFNSETLEPLYQRILETYRDAPIAGELEIVFVDDGSGDDSFATLREIAQRDPQRVRVIRLSRNFGSHAAILAGLRACRGRFAAVIGADLQEDPGIVLDMFQEANRSGAEVVLARREKRDEPLHKVAFANFYYWVMRKISDAKFPEGGFDCYLIGRPVIDALVRMNESHTSLAAQILWAGFSRSEIYYTKKKRGSGESRWTLAKKTRLFSDSLISFSRFPILLVEILGFAAALLGVCYAALIIFLALFTELPPGTRGWASTMVVLLVVAGIILVSIGIMGEYLWRILDTARRRPVYLTAETINIEEPAAPVDN